jgi:hypothetical protein
MFNILVSYKKLFTDVMFGDSDADSSINCNTVSDLIMECGIAFVVNTDFNIPAKAQTTK